MASGIEYKDIGQLFLDPHNSRFAELYSGSEKESDLIEYLLYTEAAEEIAKNISDTNYFYPDEALWVVRKKEGFLVKDGNRRCAAVKALIHPQKYGLEFPRMDIKNLPVLIYDDEKELNRRLREKHTNKELFKEWDPIAKALKAFEMHKSGSSEDSIREIDSNPQRLINLASFYHSAVKIGGEKFKKLLRRGKSKGGGKTIIFERLFKYRKRCGYEFKGKPSYRIKILDREKFESYIKAIIEYLIENPSTSHKDIDKGRLGFLDHLKKYGFQPSDFSDTLAPGHADEKKKTKSVPSKSPKPLIKKSSTKKYPKIERKQIPPKIKRIIDECYNLDKDLFANSKVAMSRVVFEGVLKYIVEETKYEGKKLSSYDHFKDAFYHKGKKRTYTKFDMLKKKFIELIKERGDKTSFENFDLEKPHQIIHNWKHGAGSDDARASTENLIHLLEFMLQEENDLINSLETSKLK